MNTALLNPAQYNDAMQQAGRNVQANPEDSPVSMLPRGYFCSVTPP
ncbi:MAG: hypothetical protein KKG12_12725 [Gammaproteobacteria bacterium]|jgi:hypothetical protein|nr:hypothetical protein [Gammaproteobacteria bacterium]